MLVQIRGAGALIRTVALGMEIRDGFDISEDTCAGLVNYL